MQVVEQEVALIDERRRTTTRAKLTRRTGWMSLTYRSRVARPGTAFIWPVSMVPTKMDIGISY